LLKRTGPKMTPRRPGRIGLMAIYLVFGAVVARTLTLEEIKPLLPRYLGLEMIYIVLFAVLFGVSRLPGWLLHFYFVLQSGLVLLILSLRPEFDFVVLLFLLLSYQASLFFTGQMRWIWVGGLVLLTGGSLIFYLGFLRGLALALTTMAAEIVIPAYLIVNQEAERARAQSQAILSELEDSRQQLQLHADRAEELAAMQERNRLARELHDTVSQFIFSISLTTRSAQLLLEKDPSRALEQLVRLQEMTGSALSQLRSLISQMRPPQQS
jgi:signal transduction histidine kinase